MASHNRKIAENAEKLEGWIGFGLALVGYAQKDVEAFVDHTNSTLESYGEKGDMEYGKASLDLANYEEMLMQMGDRIQLAKAVNFIRSRIYGD